MEYNLLYYERKVIIMKFVHIADMHFDSPFVILAGKRNWEIYED